MAYNLKEGEHFASDDELTRVSANERRATYYPQDTIFDIRTPARPVVYEKSGKPKAKIIDCKKNDKDAELPFTMLMLVPFQQEHLLEKTELQKKLNKCAHAGEAWELVRGHKIKCVEVVEASVVPYGESTARIQRFSVWEYAD